MMDISLPVSDVLWLNALAQEAHRRRVGVLISGEFQRRDPR